MLAVKLEDKDEDEKAKEVGQDIYRGLIGKSTIFT